MKRIRLDSPVSLDQAAVTVGSFDGLHIGHRAVVNRVRRLAQESDGHSVIVTFDPHPRHVIAPESAPKLLSSLDEKAAALDRMGLDCLAVVPFDDTVRQLDPRTFIDRYLVQYLQASTIVLGYDHGFGRDRSGNIDTVRELAVDRGFAVESVPPTLLDGDPVSSTRVRGYVELGKMESAKRLLGEAYPVAGEVVRGDQRGKTIGFLTANLSVGMEKLLPPNGVYAGWATLEDEQRYLAVVNLGTRPTFDGNETRFEAHLLDFQGDLYGQSLSVGLETRLRDEQKFSSIGELKKQINEDIAEARRRLDGVGILLGESTPGGFP